MLGFALLLQATVTFGVGGPATSPEYLPARVAEAAGYFAEENLRVSLQAFRSPAEAAAALAAGKVDLAATSLDAALRVGHVRGVPPRLIFGLTSVPPVAILVPAARRAEVRDLADLEGKTVGITAPGTPEAEAMAALLAQARIRPERVTLASYGERRLAQALGAGEIVAGVIGDPWATRLVRDGLATTLIDLRQPAEAARRLGGEIVHAAVFIPGASGIPEASLDAVARALLRASRRVRTAPPEALAAGLAASIIGEGDDFTLRVAGARDVFIPDGMVTSGALEASLELLQDRARLPVAVRLPGRLERLLFLEPLRRAQGSLGR